MQHQRILSRDEWLPARRRRLSREREFARRRDQLNAERAKSAAGAAFDLADWVRHEYGDDRKERASAA
jgi:predicted dithiol-disulfide oxidoreductase (DUF899 family)